MEEEIMANPWEKYQNIEQPASMKPWEKYGGTSEMPQEKDFATRMREDFAARKADIARSQIETQLGKRSNAANFINATGEGIGLIFDTAGNVIGSAARELPQSVKDAAKQGAGAFVQGAQALGQYAGEAMPQTGEALGQAVDYTKGQIEKRPITADVLGGLANIGSVVPVGKVTKQAGQAALDVARNPQVIEAAVKGANLATKPVQPLIRKLTDYSLKNQALKAGQILPEKLPKELQKVYARLRADYPDDAEFAKVLNSYASTQDKALIQTGGARTANLAEGAAQYPSGGARATEFFNEATGKAPEKLKATLGKTVSPSTKYYDDLDAMVAAGREKAAPLYQQAFKRNQVVESPVIDKILQTPEGKSALGEAVKNIQNEMARVAKPDPELTALARELGAVSEGGVSRGLKLRALDEVKKSMDGTINQAYRAGNEQEARRIINLKNTLVNELDAADKSGFYKKARSVSGDYLSNKKAMDAGLSFLTDDSEIVARTYKNLQGAEKAAYKNGVVKTIRRQIESTQDGANVARIFNKPATRDKLKSILKPQEYDRLLRDAKSTDELFKLRNQLTGNSRTAARQIAAEEFDSAGAQLVDELARKGATRTAIDKSVGWIARRFDGLSDKSAKQVADVLYETDPKKKYQIVKFLTNQANMEGSNLRKLQAQRQLEAIYGIEDKVSLIKQTEGMNAQQLQDFLNNYKK